MNVVVLSASLSAVIGLPGWALWIQVQIRLRTETAPREVPDRPAVPADRPAVPAPKPEAISPGRPAGVTRTVIEYRERPEPDLTVPGAEYLVDPEALPDEPDCAPDSVTDGARLGSLAVRAASTRGEAAREGARVRRQAVTLAVLESFDPPVLLSAVAAGRAGGRYSQVGAAVACRKIQYKVADAAVDIQAAWREGAQRRLSELLLGVLRAIGDPLTEAAKGRSLEPQDIATELTCVLTRLGDGPSRAHLAFSVGAGPVLVLRPGGSATSVLGSAGAGKRRPAALLPMEPEAVTWAGFETAPGEVAIACTSSTAVLLGRDEFSSHVLPGWLTGPPGLTRFLAQLNFADKTCREDRTAVGLWEMTGLR